MTSEEKINEHMKDLHDFISCELSFGSFYTPPLISVTIERRNNCNLTATTLMKIDPELSDLKEQAMELYGKMKGQE